MTQFAERAVASVPVSALTKSPSAMSSMVKCLEQAMHRLKNKFQEQANNLPEFFPSDEVSSWKTKLNNGCNMTLMQGEEESDLLKESLPNPTQTQHQDPSAPCWRILQTKSRGRGQSSDPERRKSSFVFPDLNPKSDKSVAKDLTSLVCACIPCVLWKFVSVKSLCCGAMTLLAWDPAVTHKIHCSWRVGLQCKCKTSTHGIIWLPSSHQF